MCAVEASAASPWRAAGRYPSQPARSPAALRHPIRWLRDGPPWERRDRRRHRRRADGDTCL